MWELSPNAHLVVTVRVHAVVMLSVLVGTVHVSTVLTSRKPEKQSCSHDTRHQTLEHVRAFHKGRSHGDETAPPRKDADSNLVIITNKSSVINRGITSPKTARNKTGERVFQRRFPHLTFKPAPAFHTAAAIYPSVTPISAELAPFISKAAVRDTYNAKPFPLIRIRGPTQGPGTPWLLYFSTPVKNRHVESMHGSFRLTAVLAYWEEGSGILRHQHPWKLKTL